MHLIIQRTSTVFTLVSLGTFLAGDLNSHAAPGGDGIPKTSQHAQFKPEKFERLAVIVKPFQAGQQGFNFANGVTLGQNRSRHDQTQMERLVEQRFMRVLLGHGYTLVSRADLDAAMREKGLDEANLTDEKLTEEAGKLLHVSAIMVVSVDDYRTTTMQRKVTRPPATTTGPGFGNFPLLGGQQTVPYYQVVASVGARLVKIDDNMVMWTGDLTWNQAYATEDQDGVVLAGMAEAIASALPRLTPLAAKKD
jgi:hypothetical protein